MSDHYVYVLQCADDSLYTGYTTDVERRVAEHDAGEGATYTRGRTPVELVHVERHGSRSAALSREHEIKALSREQKEALIEDGGEADGEGKADGESETDGESEADGGSETDGEGEADGESEADG